MHPIVPPVPGLPPLSFPYQQLLEYFQGRLNDPKLCADFERNLNSDPRWKAHWESVRHIDMERAAAVQDADDLRRFLAHVSARPAAAAPRIAIKTPRVTAATPPSGPGVIDPFCKAVAISDGMILVPVVERRAATREGDWKAWQRHVDECVYCRRMQRSVIALRERQRLDLPGPLLRDWLLRDLYAPLLDRVTNTIIKRVVVCVVFPTQEGFRAVEAEDRREELDQPTPRRGRLPSAQAWNWEARSEAAGQEAVVRSGQPTSGLPRTLELSHTLAEGRGSLTVRFEIDDRGQFLFDVVLTRAENEPTPRPVVTVEALLNEQVFTTEGAGQEVRLRPDAPLASAEGLAGQGIRVYVRQGDAIWHESAFKFGT
jgi:hypothetical protein